MSFFIVNVLHAFGFDTILCTEDWWTTFSMLLERSVHLTCSLDTIFYCPLNLQSFMTLRMSVIDVELECGVLISSTSYFGFCSNPVQP